MSYSKRGDLAVDLRKLTDQLTCACRDEQPEQQQSVQTVGGTRRTDLLEDRLSQADIRELVSAFQSGTPKWKLAEQYGISLSSVKRVLRKHGTRRQDKAA